MSPQPTQNAQNEEREERAVVTRRSEPTRTNPWFVILAVGVVILLGAGMFALGRWMPKLGGEPAPPPPSESVPDAPGPDNQIKSFSPDQQPETGTGSQE